MDDVITLVKIIYGEDENGHETKREELKTNLFCEKGEISQREYNLASQNRLSASMKIIISDIDYGWEEYAIYKNQKFKIYRTYLRNDDRIELYLAELNGHV